MAHARYDDERFVRELFVDPNNLLNHPDHGVRPFEFARELERMRSEATCHEGFYFAPEFKGNIVEIPEELRDAF
jgi:hypothetical protein